ncbi:MAG: hypothetical protein A3G93_05970 [Nitrospinae bacterium RIFCSPLOWO2_12_FULL_45_22]|nr:MAG: hypothetical protein A3G93_05970 [Nitrospinae bacterium RIFCSPLOWO2_12_FULL_45_22]
MLQFFEFMLLKRGSLKVFIYSVISLSILGYVTLAYPAGFEWEGLGARAGGMGGAFIGLADDWTAIYWNPAGITQLKGKGFGIVLYNMNDFSKDNDSVSNPDLPANERQAQQYIKRGEVFNRIYGSESLRFEREWINLPFFQPSMGGYFKWKGFNFGASLYTPLGNWLDWDDTILDRQNNARIDASYHALFLMPILNFSVAKKITPNLSLGTGLNILISNVQYNIDKDYFSTTQPELNYAYDFEQEGRGIGLEGVFGLLWRVRPWLSIGAVYRTGDSLEIEGDAFVRQTALGINESSNYTQRLPMPATWGIGIALKPLKKLTITFDWQRSDWTTMKWDFNYNIADEKMKMLKDMNVDLDWRATTRYRVGLEWKFNDRWTFRSGYFQDRGAYPSDDIAGFTTTPYDNEWGVSWGIGFKKGLWSFDARFEWLQGDRGRERYGVEHYCPTFEYALTRTF